MTNVERLELLRSYLPRIGRLLFQLLPLWVLCPYEYALAGPARAGDPAGLAALCYGTAAVMLIWELVVLAALRWKKVLLFVTYPTLYLGLTALSLPEPPVGREAFLALMLLFTAVKGLSLLCARAWLGQGWRDTSGWLSYGGKQMFVFSGLISLAGVAQAVKFLF